MFFNREKRIKRIDIFLLIVVAALIGFGLVVLKSATMSYTPEKAASYFRTQVFSTLLGWISICALMFIPPEWMRALRWPIYIFCTLLLVYTLFWGKTKFGAKSWVAIGGFQFQPSEIVKIGLIVSLGAFLDRAKDRLNEPFTLLRLVALAALPIALIFLQPDAGTGLVFCAIVGVMFFMGGISLRYVFAAIGMLILAIPVLWYRLASHGKTRIFDFLNQERDIQGSNLQGYIGKLMVGSGKFEGRGLFKGVLNQYNYLPLKHSDFIFPVAVEELGFLGASALLTLYMLMLFRMLIIAKESDYYGRVIISGISAMFLIHIWENIAMTIGLMPITGIPLPFFSHGGTFQLMNLIAVGLVLGIRYHNRSTLSPAGQKIENLLT